MPTYETICRDWFFLRHPEGTTYESFEAEPAPADRERTSVVLSRMRDEVPATAARLLGVTALPFEISALGQIDVRLTPALIQPLLAASSPDDPNNDFKLTISEFAVFLGQVAISRLGGEWRYSRMPNYFQSIVRVHGLELFVFDMLMKKVSDDFHGESLLSKLSEIADRVRLQVS